MAFFSVVLLISLGNGHLYVFFEPMIFFWKECFGLNLHTTKEVSQMRMFYTKLLLLKRKPQQWLYMVVTIKTNMELYLLSCVYVCIIHVYLTTFNIETSHKWRSHQRLSEQWETSHCSDKFICQRMQGNHYV